MLCFSSLRIVLKLHAGLFVPLSTHLCVSVCACVLSHVQPSCCRVADKDAGGGGTSSPSGTCLYVSVVVSCYVTDTLAEKQVFACLRADDLHSHVLSVVVVVAFRRLPCCAAGQQCCVRARCAAGPLCFAPHALLRLEQRQKPPPLCCGERRSPSAAHTPPLTPVCQRPCGKHRRTISSKPGPLFTHVADPLKANAARPSSASPAPLISAASHLNSEVRD